MKRIFTIFFMLFNTIGFSQEDQRKKDRMILFAPTPKGIPDGEAASKKIGKEGGRIMSADKKLEIIIPVGALITEKTISIQPTTNLAKAGVGKSYHMEPSGIQFQQPVELIFHYTDDNVKEGSQELLSISTQNENGNWLRFENVKVDTLAKTVSGTTNHFSVYTITWAVVMWANANRVKVGKDLGVTLYVTPINADRDEASLKDFVGAHFAWFGRRPGHPRNWSVNGVAHGNSIEGDIREPEDEYSVIYQAPSQIPENNPVLIEVEITGIPFEGKLMNIKRTTSVQVYDKCYEVNMAYEIKGGSPRAFGGNMTRQDNGAFIVCLDKKEPEIVQNFNRVEVMTYDNCPDRTILNPTTCTGILHVKGLKTWKITPANLPAVAHASIELWFLPHPTESVYFRFNCPPPPGSKGGRSKGKIDPASIAGPTLMMQYNQSALPHYIQFFAKDGEQVFAEYGKPGGEYYLKISVTRMEE